MSNSLQTHGLYSPLNSPGQNTGVGSLPFSRGSSQPRDRTQVSCVAGGFFTSWATREAQEYWSGKPIPSPGDLPIQGSNSGLLHCRWVLYQLSYQGIPESIFFFKIYFNWRLITLQYCGSFCHTFTWISHGCTFVPHLENPSHLSLHPIPQGHPSAPALSTLSHASNLDWRAVSHMVIYMFQCYSLKSSHPHLLPQSPKVCSLHLMSKSVYVCLSVCVCV